MTWHSRATSAKCELCGHGYTDSRNWSAWYSIGDSVTVAWCRACQRTRTYLKQRMG
jgi:hypothetical protein